MKLLTERNYKTDKSVDYGYLTAVLLLEPNYIDKRTGTKTCPDAGQCVQFCLSKCGRNKYVKSQRARLKRTFLFFNNPAQFYADLCRDLMTLEAKAERLGLKPAVRLNGLSDLPWEELRPGIFHAWRNVQFYDYTKSCERMTSFVADGTWPANYHLTYSENERTPGGFIRGLLQCGANSARIYSGTKGNKRFGEVWRDTNGQWPNIDGDIHDLRFLDPKGVIVWLSLKQPYRMNTGFKIDASALVQLGK